MGGVVKGIGGAVSSVSSPLASTINPNDLTKYLNDVMSSMSNTSYNTLSGVKGSMTGIATAANSGQGGAKQQTVEQVAGEINKLAFLVVLQDSMQRVQNGARFNLDNAVKELMQKLQTLQAQPASAEDAKLPAVQVGAEQAMGAGAMRHQMQQQNEMMQMISTMLQKQHETVNNIISNIR